VPNFGRRKAASEKSRRITREKKQKMRETQTKKNKITIKKEKEKKAYSGLCDAQKWTGGQQNGGNSDF